QWPAVATRLPYRDCTEVAEHQCGLRSAPMKNTLPTVRGRLTFFDVATAAFLSLLEPTMPGLPLAEVTTPALTLRALTVVSTLYGVALRRLAIFSANQNAATCWAAKLVLARL